MKRFLHACVGLLIGSLSPVYAHDLYALKLGDLDRDQDNALTIEEMNVAVDLYFTAHDENGDGQLSLGEFPNDKNQLRAGLKRVPKKRVMPDPITQANALLERLDADENGGLSFEELNASALKRFDAQDIDGDGELTAQELEDGAVARAEKRSAKPKTSLSRAHKVFIKWDANKDGQVAKAEVPSAKIQKNLGKVFADLDVNKDGIVSIEEFSILQQ